ncbi:hypothetical protein [Streptomyces sp. TRM75563]|uniref:hypothetical protein n=1 Tax=Streptomyces sp. TRM75563 TaxID=2817418 RepID=UPI00325B4F3C
MRSLYEAVERRHSGYGIPVTAVGALNASGRIAMSDFTGQLAVPHLPALHFERHAQVALLWTPRDRREDWLRAGQAQRHVLLTATSYGVRTSILHQVMEDGSAGGGERFAAAVPAAADPVRVRHRGRSHPARGRVCRIVRNARSGGFR